MYIDNNIAIKAIVLSIISYNLMLCYILHNAHIPQSCKWTKAGLKGLRPRLVPIYLVYLATLC